MNQDILAVHTLCRYYCIGKIKEYKDLISKYRNIELMSGWSEELGEDSFLAESSKEILKAILIGIESINLKEFKEISKIKDKIVYIIKNTQIKESCRNIYKSMNLNINKEKEQFNNFINDLKDDDFIDVEPLFYRKVLSESEIYRLLNNVDTLETLQNIYFKSEELENIVKEIDFTEVLFKHGVKKVYQLSRSTTFNTSFEMDLCAFNPFVKYSSGDWYWFDTNLDWMIYFDHEGYKHIYGKWFIDELGLNLGQC